jgi:hypothetical protein
MAVLPPVFLATFVAPLFVICTVLFAGGAALFAITLGLALPQAREVRVSGVQEVREQFARAWQALSKDVSSYMSVIVLVLASVTALVTVSLAPRFVDRVLGVEPQYAVFVLSPAVLGIVAGMRLAQVMEQRISKPRVVALSFAVLVAGMVVIGMIRPVGGWVEGVTGLNATGARLLVTTLLTVALAGSYTLINISARSVVNERVPLDMQGRVFAAQTVLSNLASIAPILLTGLVAQVVGVDRVFVAVGLVIGVVAVWYWLRSVYSGAPQ